MLDEKQILENKEKFINLLNNVKREGADISGLIKKLENSDFFTAPASTQYHCAYKGGLCYHSLNVYKQLKKLISIEYPEFEVSSSGEMKKVENYVTPFLDETLIIVSLLHDMSKMNFYEMAERNTKDEKGNWVKVPYIKVKEAKDRFLFGNHEMNSLYMVETFIPLNIEEAVAITHHMGGKASDSSGEDITPIFNRYSLSILLHTADMLATFIDERI